ncbi:MAG: hypothetical protein J6A41_07135 [Ruminiclostridium sp.]|nr:hypothetical protein [Ruminiclostridium sp.]
MKSYFINLASYTEANRAARYLRSIKINAEVEKGASGGGCSYGIRVYENPERVCRLLSAVNIRCGKIKN